MKIAHFAALLLVSSACSAPVPCGPSTCTGCCDSSGLCRALSSSAACGSNGAACVNCGTQACSFGACVGGFGQAGGFSGTGGGFSGTGGGSSAGGSATAGGRVGGGNAAGGAAAGGGSATGGGSIAGGPAAGGPTGGGFVLGGGPATAGGAAATAPDVLLLVDTSGSMNNPINPSEPSCGSCSGVACPSSCPTRLSVLRNALASYLQPNATAARFGLTTFPSTAVFTPSGCGPASTQAVAMLAPSTATSTSALVAQTTNILSFLSGLGTTTQVVGGTPTGASLRYAATISALSTSSGRARGVVLITDGLPNCNPANPLSCNSQPPPPVDLCTLGANCVAGYCQAGYLDQTGTVQAVAALRLAGVKTAIVVIDNAPTAQVTSVMNAMADEGGATACASTNPGCLQRFFPANDQTSLLTAISSAVARVSVP